MKNPDDRTILHQLKVLSQIEPDEASAKLALEHARAAARDLSVIAVNGPTGQARTWKRLPHFLEGLTMRQLIVALGGVGVAALLGFLLLWGGIGTKPLSAMEKMAESVRKAKSFRAAMFWEEKRVSKHGKPPFIQRGIETVYWLASGSCRSDYKAHVASEDKEGTTLYFARTETAIVIDHKAKKWFKCESPKEEYVKILELEKLSKFSGQADRDLGAKEINGKKARGFEIDMKKLFEPPDDTGAKDVAEVWIDSESSLPVLVHFNYTTDLKRKGCGPLHVRFQDFQWNIALDPKLFDATPPEGYRDVTPKGPEPGAGLSLDEQVRRITEGLSLFANGPSTARKFKGDGKLFGGHYPQDIRKAKREGRIIQWVDDSGKVKETRFGIPEIAYILKKNPDAAYYGKTVGPKDKNKVLLRWKLDDGRYEVIFGDLRNETVTAEGLRKLEGK